MADSDACPPAPRQVVELAADVLPVYLLYQSCSAGNFLYKGRMDGCGAAPQPAALGHAGAGAVRRWPHRGMHGTPVRWHAWGGAGRA